MSLNLEHLRFINAARAARWHKGGIESWSITDWMRWPVRTRGLIGGGAREEV